ncbi:MAG: TraB/GumN family protein [Lentilitoribacter sp.]
MTKTITWRKLLNENIDHTIAIGLHVLALISFVVFTMFAVNTVQSEEIDKSCIGNNLINELPSQALEDARSEAAKTPNGQGLFWKISKDGKQPSWLYGTMHVTDPRILNLSDPVTKAIDQSDTVVIETLDLLDPLKAQAALLKNPELTMFTNGQKLTSTMSEDDKSFVETELKERGIPASFVARMKPWMVMSLVSVPDCEQQRKASGEQILDFAIVERAKTQGKDLKGLETILEQVTAMASLPIDFQVKGLVESLRLGDLLTDVSETMTQLYLQEDIALITPALKAVAKELGQEEDPNEDFGAFEAKIILERNYLMAERAEPILNDGNAFIAIGALHLPGEEGVIELLRKQGFEITRVQ